MSVARWDDEGKTERNDATAELTNKEIMLSCLQEVKRL